MKFKIGVRTLTRSSFNSRASFTKIIDYMVKRIFVLFNLPAHARKRPNGGNSCFMNYLNQFLLLFLVKVSVLNTENRRSTCNQLNGRKNSPVATKQLHLVFSFNDTKLAAINVISALEYPHKIQHKIWNSFWEKKTLVDRLCPVSELKTTWTTTPTLIQGF